MIIYIDVPLKEKQKAALKENLEIGYELRFKDELKNDEARLESLQNADIVFGNPKPDWMKKAAKAQWIQLYSAGFEYYQGIRLPAVVTNMKDYYSQPCAETIVAGIMALYRKIDEFAVLKDKKQWVGPPIRLQLQLLNHKKVIILGTGNIGRRIAKILAGFDAEIVFFGRTAPDAQLRSATDLNQKIPWADIIIGCLPGTAETKGLFTKKMMGAMKPAALFCNVGRGNLVADQDALIEALMNHTIGGAVLDVTAAEPIADDSKLWDCPNTILSQHSGGGQLSEYDGIVDLFISNLKKFTAGSLLKNEIDFNKGY